MSIGKLDIGSGQAGTKHGCSRMVVNVDNLTYLSKIRNAVDSHGLITGKRFVSGDRVIRECGC